MSFNCQRCRQSLQISPSLIQQQQQGTSETATTLTAASPSLIALSNPNPNPNPTTSTSNSLSTRLAHSESLHSIINHLNHIPQSSNDDQVILQHPLCTECTSSLLHIMRLQVDNNRRQRDAMVAWRQEAIRGTGNAEVDAQNHNNVLLQEIHNLHQEYQSSTSNLREAEAERLQLEKDLKEIELQEMEMETRELEFWASHRSSLLLHSNLSKQTSSLKASINHSKVLLNRLNSTEVYNDVFSIGQDSGVATINGLRLGRSIHLPSTTSSSSSNTHGHGSKSTSNTIHSSSNDKSIETNGGGGDIILPIEWPEINAAWGQTALLIETLRNKLGLEEWENGWKIFPRGSYSWLEKFEKGNQNERGEKYELYNNSNWELGKLLHSRRFDNAMVGFLDCLRQLGEIVESRSEEQDGENGQSVVKLPHIINKDRIGGASIRLQFGNDETWTRALRHVLLTLRILLSWVVKHTSDDE